MFTFFHAYTGIRQRGTRISCVYVWISWILGKKWGPLGIKASFCLLKAQIGPLQAQGTEPYHDLTTFMTQDRICLTHWLPVSLPVQRCSLTGSGYHLNWNIPLSMKWWNCSDISTLTLAEFQSKLFVKPRIFQETTDVLGNEILFLHGKMLV